MNQVRNIREGFKKLAEKHGPLQTILATVVSVDEGEMTCVVDDDGNEINDVRLRPVLNGKDAINIIPKVGSWVLMTRIEDDEAWTVIQCDEIAKYSITAGNAVFEYDGSKFKMSNATASLKDIVQLVIEATQQIVVMMGNNPNYGKLTQALTKLNSLMQ